MTPSHTPNSGPGSGLCGAVGASNADCGSQGARDAPESSQGLHSASRTLESPQEPADGSQVAPEPPAAPGPAQPPHTTTDRRAGLDRARKYLVPVAKLDLPDHPDLIHLSVYEWLPQFEAWATGIALCGYSTRQGALPADTEITCQECLKYRPGYLRALAAQAEPKPIPVPSAVFDDLIRVVAHVSAGKSFAFDGQGPYPDATARRVLGALDDAGLLDDWRKRTADAAPAESGACTATFYEGWIGTETVVCTQPAGHYDETVPIRDSDADGPTDPGGWHFATYPDGKRVAWCDRAERATPHDPTPPADTNGPTP